MSDYVAWLRSKVGPRRVFLAYATAIVDDGAGNILCQRRRDFDCWGLPGGALEIGETLEQCLEREVREETGCSVAAVELVGLYSSPDYDITYPNGDQVQQFTACFRATLSGGGLRPDGRESEEIRFFSAARPPALFPWYRDMLEDCRRGARRVFARGAPGAAVDTEPLFRRLRPLVGRETLIVPSAAAIIRDGGGRVLLLRRMDDGEWTLPGGALELGERADTALVRETREEAGVTVEPVELLDVRSGPELQVTFPNGDRIQAANAFFACRIVAGTPSPDNEEASEARFFAPRELPDRPAWLALLRRFLEEGPDRLSAARPNL